MGWNYRRWILEELAAALSPEWDNHETRFPSSLSLSSLPESVRKTQLELAENELRFTLRKIENNFSNFSAWHQRSKLLPCVWDANKLSQEQRMLERNKGMLKVPLTAEFELLQQAMYTDPSDQSIWIYHHWLVSLSTYEETNSRFRPRDIGATDPFDRRARRARARQQMYVSCAKRQGACNH